MAQVGIHHEQDIGVCTREAVEDRAGEAARGAALDDMDPGRFESVGDYASYCRMVKSERLSNGKKKGEGNRKSGNRYQSWAFVEAAHLTRRHCPQTQRFYERKRARTRTAVASKALAHKLARASYYLIRDGVEFDVKRCFG